MHVRVLVTGKVTTLTYLNYDEPAKGVYAYSLVCGPVADRRRDDDKGVGGGRRRAREGGESGEGGGTGKGGDAMFSGIRVRVVCGRGERSGDDVPAYEPAHEHAFSSEYFLAPISF